MKVLTTLWDSLKDSLNTLLTEAKTLSKRALVTAAVLVAVIAACSCGLGGLIGSSSNGGAHAAGAPTAPAAAQVAHNTPTPKPTPKPTATPKPKVWTVTNTFTGNGDQQTADFTVPGANWRMVWSCDPASSFDGEYNVAADVDPIDGSLGDPAAINTICQSGNVSGTTNIHDLGQGTYYLDVTSEGAWSIKVEVYE